MKPITSSLRRRVKEALPINPNNYGAIGSYSGANSTGSSFASTSCASPTSFYSPSNQSSNNWNQTKPNPNKQKRNLQPCTFCHLRGHHEGICYKKHGYPPGYVPRRPNTQNTQNQTHIAVQSGNEADVDKSSTHASFGTFTHDQVNQLLQKLPNTK